MSSSFDYPQPPNPSSLPSFNSPTSPLFSPHSARKRRADSPPSPLSPNGVWSAPASSPEMTSPALKRRRPNLANGFSALSIAPRSDDRASPLPTYEESQAVQAQHVDEDDHPGSSTRSIDVRVEILPDGTKKPRRSEISRPTWSVPSRAEGSTSSTTSDTESEGEYDSDATFRLRSRHLMGRAQQADSVEQPETVPEAPGDLGVEDVTDRMRGRKRGSEEVGGAVPGHLGKRPRNDSSMDLDMEVLDEDMPSEETEDSEETPRDKIRRSKTTWHRPEKDRIVITSISPSSSRSTSPDGSSSRNLSQPGEQGFTLSPSLLTHLLAAQREHWSSYGTTPNLSFDIPNRERGLVLYRPLGIPPGITEEVARMWSEGGVPTHDDEARFEDLDNEEVIQAEPSAAMEVDDDMDVDMS